MTKSIPAGLTRVVIAGALCAGLVGGCSRGNQQQGGGGGFSMPPMPVQTADVAAGTVENRYSVVGTLEAVEAITVVAEISGRVVALPFREGQPIARGALIAQLDDTELAAEVARAEAQVAQRQSSYDRIRLVADQGAGTPQDLDDADAALKIAAADLAMVRARLAKTRITAPFAGITGARKVSVGAYLTGVVPITDLARIDELRVVFTAPERMLSHLQQGSPVTITTTAYPDHVLQGTIDVIDPSLDPDTRAAHIVARVNNPDRLLRPGMSANVSVILESRDQAMTVPSEAVFVQARPAHGLRGATRQHRGAAARPPGSAGDRRRGDRRRPGPRRPRGPRRPPEAVPGRQGHAPAGGRRGRAPAGPPTGGGA